jgi:hypothetical protein
VFQSIMDFFLKLVFLSLTPEVFSHKSLILDHTENVLSLSVVEVIKDFYITQGSNIHLIKAIERTNHFKFEDTLRGIMKNLESTEISTQLEDLNDMRKINNYKRYSVVIFIDTMKSVNELFIKFLADRFRFRKYFLIVSILTLEHNEVEQIFDHLWKLPLINVNFVMISKENIVTMQTFFPFNQDKCGDTSPISINIFNITSVSWEHKEFYPKKTSDMQKCPLIIGYASVIYTNEFRMNNKFVNHIH